jgi:rhamnosyltransferase
MERGIELIANPDNLGIAAALNQGLAALRGQGFAWCLTMDQDSLAAPDLVACLWQRVARSGDPARIALVAPNVADAGMPEGSRRWLSLEPVWGVGFRRLPCSREGLSQVVAITSGSLTNLEVWEALGGFDGELFIDYVDTDYCLRAVRAGYRVEVECGARLEHRVGSKTRHRWWRFTLTPTHHSPLRRYYLCRNRLRMVRRHGFSWPHWLMYELAATAHTTLAILLAESQPMEKLRACLLGTWDGLRGRWGKAQRAFEPAHAPAGESGADRS